MGTHASIFARTQPEPFERPLALAHIILFKSRLSLKQEIPENPKPWGVNVWAVACLCTIDFLFSFFCSHGYLVIIFF